MSQGFSRSGTYVFEKFNMAAKRYVEVVIPELLDICFNVIPHFHMIFNAEFISEVINNFQDTYSIRIRDTYKLLNL